MNASTALDFPAAVARRLSPRTLAFALPMLAPLVFIGGLGFGGALGASPTAKVAILTTTAVMGLVILVAVVIADEAVDRGAPRLPNYAMAVVLGAIGGALLGWELREALGLPFELPGSKVVLPAHHPEFYRLCQMAIGILVGGLATFVHVTRRTALAARRRQQEAERARAVAGRRTLESQLQALQARVEPMFLFGTLAHIRGLYRSDARAAGAMLEDLIEYLRAALPHLRESTSELGQELKLVRAWLDIMGRSLPGLRFEIDAAPAAQGARLPALVLLPLVQHAVARPGTNGPRLRIGVTASGARLHIELLSGNDAFGAGIAGVALLEQIDERLRVLYGEQARFEAGPAQPAGSRAAIELPLLRASADDDPQGDAP
ncbi:histidine kinase [Rivibacter subsaxonicus]|uniref:Histidine kinase n=1 Tax=Rivibacter subsaxonicus TaxID=457575 RepID=A0A4Q7VG68_9BURK|nr:sensor histidine kinase [Rivibacter subsaxonicus]RZT95016.1 histidine kinase [Rivibacter subsaxonicus]